MSIPDFFRPHITFNHSITPIALDQLQLAILRLGDDATDPSAVGTSTEPDVRICLVIFLRQVATYSDSGTIRRTIGDILFVPEFSLDLLHVADEDDDEGSTSRAARVRNMIKPISRARRGKCWVTLLVRSPDVDDMSPLIFRMIVRAPPPLPSAPPRDRVEVVIPVRHRTFSWRSTPSLMFSLCFSLAAPPSPPPPPFLPPFLLSPCFPLSRSCPQSSHRPQSGRRPPL